VRSPLKAFRQQNPHGSQPGIDRALMMHRNPRPSAG
jgi:hypothetical protein